MKAAHRLRRIARIYPERAVGLIADAIASTGSLPKAAKVLGIHRVTLWKLRQRLGSDRVFAAARERMRGCRG
jgi:transcriptional regulator of acetoin/glycerol metabolism